MPHFPKPHKLVPATPDELDGLIAWAGYWPGRSALFKDKNQAAWFIRTRRDALIAAGVLFDSLRGYLVHAARLDAMLPDLMGINRLAPADPVAPQTEAAAA